MTQPIVRPRIAPIVLGALALTLALVAAPGTFASDETVPAAEALAESAPEIATAPAAAAGSCAIEPTTAEAVLLSGPGGVEDYCTECRPCTRQIDCGWDNGYLGVCVSNPSHCNSGGRSACICY